MSDIDSIVELLQGQDGSGMPRRSIVDLVDPGRPYAVTLSVRPREGGRFSTLTPREREVGALVAAGLGNREIAAELVLSVATVKDHVHRILQKSGLRSRAAVAAAWR